MLFTGKQRIRYYLYFKRSSSIIEIYSNSQELLDQGLVSSLNEAAVRSFVTMRKDGCVRWRFCIASRCLSGDAKTATPAYIIECQFLGGYWANLL